MAVQKAYTSAAILRMEKLCSMAAAEPEGISVKFGSKTEALRLRQQIYTARNALFRRDPNAVTPLATVEMAVIAVDQDPAGPHNLSIRPQFTGLTNLDIVNNATDEKMKLPLIKEEDEWVEVNRIAAEIRRKEGAFDMADPDFNRKMSDREAEATALFNKGYRAQVEKVTFDPSNLNLGLDSE